MLAELKEMAFKAARSADEALGQIHFDLGHDYKDTTILAGSARGGTTWIAELINFDNSYRLIFEAISHERDSTGKTYMWGRYLRTKDEDPHFLEPVRKIVSGRSRQGYSDRFNRQLFPRRRLMKEIGENLLLHWLHVHFPEIPIALLLRHPCGVAASRVRNGWDRPNEVAGFLKQEPLMKDFLSPFRSDMENATFFESNVMHWCVETLVPLKQFRPGEIHLAFYENFCVEPEREVSRLFEFLGRPLDGRISRVLDRPSKQTRLRKSNETRPSFDSWRRHLTDDEIRTASDVLRRFGLGSLYRADGMPDMDAAFKMLQS
jgi:Sulfotransferase domain